MQTQRRALAQQRNIHSARVPRHAVVARAAAATVVDQRLPAGRAAAHAPSSSNGNWAIVKVSGTNQWVEVGRSLAVKSCQLGEATVGKLVQFKEVLAFKGTSLKKGKPYLTDVIVEGLVADQFVGPAAGSAGPLSLSKVLITKIQHEEEQQQEASSSETMN